MIVNMNLQRFSAIFLYQYVYTLQVLQEQMNYCTYLNCIHSMLILQGFSLTIFQKKTTPNVNLYQYNFWNYSHSSP